MIIWEIECLFNFWLRNRKLTNLVGNRFQAKIETDNDVTINRSKVNGRLTIGRGSTIYRSTLSGDVKIGRYTSVSGPNIFMLSKKTYIEIGSFTSIARGVNLQEYDHDMSKLSTSFVNKKGAEHMDISEFIVSRGPIKIGSDVWIGLNCTVLSGVTVGNGAIVAAGAVVTKNVDPYSIVAGVPATKIGMRFNPNTVKELLAECWWELPIEQVRSRYENFGR